MKKHINKWTTHNKVVTKLVSLFNVSNQSDIKSDDYISTMLPVGPNCIFVYSTTHGRPRQSIKRTNIWLLSPNAVSGVNMTPKRTSKFEKFVKESVKKIKKNGMSKYLRYDKNI